MSVLLDLHGLAELVHSGFKSAEARQAMFGWMDRVVGQMPCTVSGKMVPTRYGETHVLQAGPDDAPPVVLLHGLGLNAASWWRQIPALAQQHRVHAIDVVGAAGKSSGIRPPALQGYAWWLVDALDGLGISSAAFVGHSLGGWITLQLAGSVEGAARIKSAVLISSSGITRVSLRGLWTVGSAIALGGGSVTGTETFLKRLAAPLWTPDPLLVEMFHLVLAGLKPLLVPAIAYSPRHLGRLKAPVSVFVGEHEVLFASNMMERARHCFPSLRHAEVIAAAGHCLPWEQPDDMNARILACLQTG